MVKILMTWNIRAGKERDYWQFLQDLGKELLEMGLQLSEAWSSVWGEAPDVLIGASARDLDTAEEILASDKWSAFVDRLETFARDFDYKVVEQEGLFQI